MGTYIDAHTITDPTYSTVATQIIRRLAYSFDIVLDLRNQLEKRGDDIPEPTKNSAEKSVAGEQLQGRLEEPGGRHHRVTSGEWRRDDELATSQQRGQQLRQRIGAQQHREYSITVSDRAGDHIITALQ